MVLFYAIIYVCLASCSTDGDRQAFIYQEPVAYEQCVVTTEEMKVALRSKYSELVHRPLSSLCVREDLLKNKDKYRIF